MPDFIILWNLDRAFLILQQKCILYNKQPLLWNNFFKWTLKPQTKTLKAKKLITVYEHQLHIYKQPLSAMTNKAKIHWISNTEICAREAGVNYKSTILPTSGLHSFIQATTLQLMVADFFLSLTYMLATS